MVINLNDVNPCSHNTLVNQCADEMVSVLKRPKQLTNAAGHGSIERITIKQYFQEYALHDRNPNYDWVILHELVTGEKLQQHILAKELINRFPKLTSYRLWVTPHNGFTGAHFDACETFNLQLSGQKRFVLYPPGIKRYHARSPLSKFGHTSKFNDFEQVEKTKTWQQNMAQRLEFILNPGDMIYIPPGWWHQVYTQNGICMNVLINFSAGKKLLKHPYILLDLMIKYILNKNNLHTRKAP